MGSTRKVGADASPAPQEVRGAGNEIRLLRTAKRMTLHELAKASGRSPGHLSQIERGAIEPTLSVLQSIADALGVELGFFFPAEPGANNKERNVVVRSQTRRRLSRTYSFDTAEIGFEDFLLSADLGLDLCMGLARVAPGGATNPGGMTNESHHCGYILSGQVELHLDDERFLLRDGDSFSFDGRREHVLRNPTDMVAEVIWCTTPVRLNY
jgi:transcriptional regulator with XRE-family HTH domain